MEFQKLFIKIAYWLVGISILVLLGLTFFGHHLVQMQPENTATNTGTKIKYKGMSITIGDANTLKDSKKINGPADKETDSKAGSKTVQDK